MTFRTEHLAEGVTCILGDCRAAACARKAGGVVRMYRLHRWVRHHEAMAYCASGWLPLPSLAGTHHGEYSVHMAWLCQCEPVEPRGRVA